MAGAVQFDREFQRWTVEIEDVRVNWMLPPKFVTGKFSISKVTPQNAFTAKAPHLNPLPESGERTAMIRLLYNIERFTVRLQLEFT